MASKTRTFLQALFVTTYIPQESDYDSVWDSFFNLLDDSSDAIANGSGVSGTSVSDALDALKVKTDQIEPTYVILRSTGPAAHRWKITIDDTGELNKEDLGV